MPSDFEKFAFRARWVLPVTAPPIENGIIGVENGRIISVESAATSTWRWPIKDLDNSVLIPGLINAHTHLEFSNLAKPLGHSGIEFTDWIRLVVDSRRRIFASGEIGPSKTSAVVSGLQESRNAGVVALGEIATEPIFKNLYAGIEFAGVLFRECLGRDPLLIDKKVAALKNDQSDFCSGLEFGYSPHAPYSIHPQLLEKTIAAAKPNTPFAMHLAETKAELDLIKNLDGPFVELLKDLDAWFPDSYRAGETAQDYLNTLATCPNALVIHGNYLTACELDFVAKCKKMSIVFCPRTHQFFKHSDYPIMEMLERKINVAVGTDSRASNPDLNLLEDLKCIAQTFPEVSPEMVLELGTINGAKALGIEKDFGSIEAGKLARLGRIELDDSQGPFRSLFAADSQVKQVEV